MEYGFFALLVLLWIIFYRLDNYRLIRPSMFYLTMTLISTIFYLTASEQWDMHLSFEGAGILLIGVICFRFGETISLSLCSLKRKIKEDYRHPPKIIFSMDKKYMLIILVIILLCIKLSFDRMLDLAGTVGLSLGDENMMGGVRNALHAGEKTGVGLGFLRISCDAISFLFQFLFINNIFQNKKYISYLCISLLALIPNLMFGARIGLINYVFVGIGTMAVLMQFYHNWSYRWGMKQFIQLGVIGCIMLSIFLLLGTFTGKVEFANLISPLQIYIGFPIPGVDYILSNPNTFDENIPGEKILSSLYALLYRLDFSDINIENGFQPFAFFAGRFAANTYGATGDWYIAAGFCGVVLGQAFVGFIYGWALARIRTLSKLNYFIVIYCYFTYVFMDRITAERFFNKIFAFQTIILLFVAWLLFHYLVKIIPIKDEMKR